MTPERWQQINRVLDAALECDEARRAAFLDAACGDDDELRHEVESLLDFDARAGEFIERPALVRVDTREAEPPASLVGRLVDHYQIEDRLGAGGMGEVYRARDTRLGRRVALKLLRAEYARDGQLVRRFEQEARAASSLNHPNIVTVYDVGEADGRRYIATEYVEGETLRERLRNGLGLREAAGIAAQVAEALAAAHASGIVHRDIKPENLMLRPDGYVKVLDFGIAKLAGQLDANVEGETAALERVTDAATSAGTVMGTIGYMSPEQARGQSVDARSDIWSLGVVFYELVTGREPFDGATRADVLAAILEREPAPVTTFLPHAPAALDLVVRRTLAKAREDRYGAMKDLLGDLRRLARDLGIVEHGRGGLPERAQSLALTQEGLSTTDEWEAGSTTVKRRTTAAGSQATNLPRPLTSFVGRSDDVAAIMAALTSTRLLTLKGVGGIGKTRLALEVGREWLRQQADAVWVVELAALRDGALVAHAIGTVLGVREQPGRSMESSLCEALRRQHLLLVLDNCEHLAEACTRMCEALLRECQGIRVLATSREPLRVAGEVLWDVEPLTANAAVRLFVERARASRRAFELTEAKAGPVARLCQRLEGIPLAVELAAARVKALSVEQILSRMDDRFQLLKVEERAGATRQQTLRTTIDWSYELLDEAERTLLRRLAVFAGGWTLEAAEGICGNDECRMMNDEFQSPSSIHHSSFIIHHSDVLQHLERLIDKSLVVMEERGEAARYRMLETIREYAWEKLEESAEAHEIVARHADWFVSLAERIEDEGRRDIGVEHVFLDLLDAEHDNFRAVLRRTLRGQGDTEASLRLCAALGHFWLRRGYLSEARRWLDTALSTGPRAPTGPRGSALLWAGHLAFSQADYDRARELLDEAALLFRASEDRRNLARTLSVLGLLLATVGDFDQALPVSEESMRLARELGVRSMIAMASIALGSVALERGEFDRAARRFEECLAINRQSTQKRDVANVLLYLGAAARYQGRLERAEEVLGESLEIARDLDDAVLLAQTCQMLGAVATERGDYDRALSLHEKALEIFRELDARYDIACTLEGVACVIAARGGAKRALRLEGFASRLRETIKAARSAPDQGILDRYLAPVRQALGADTAERILAEGRVMTLQQALEYAHGDDG